MSEYLSLPECSRRYMVSEKTLHNWIRSGLLQADKVRVYGRMQYLIDPAKLEKVMTDRNMLAFPVRASTFHDNTDTLARLEALEQRVRVLEDRLHALETPPVYFSEIDTPLPVHPASTPSQRVHHTLPPGYVLFKPFFHGVNRSAAIRWLKASPYCEQQGIGHGAQFILSPEGQRAYCVWASERYKQEFERCDRCPHAVL